MALSVSQERFGFATRDESLPPPRARAGDWVKIGSRGERFWCKVERGPNASGVLSVRVDNVLVKNEWRLGDRLEVRTAHVLEVATAAELTSFQRLATESSRGVEEAAREWHESRVGGRQPHSEHTVYMVGSKAAF
jgi:hypothetical protein